MKTVSLLLVLCLAAPAAAQDFDAATFQGDAPLVAPTVFPPGELPPGRSVKLQAGQPAPFPGQLLDEQEQVRRSRVNRRNEAELRDLKKGNVTLSVPVAIAIVAGVLVAGAAAGAAITVAATAPKPQP